MTEDNSMFILTNANDPEVLAAEEDAAFSLAAEAYERQKLSFSDQLNRCGGLKALQRRALRDSNSPKPYGPKYTARYAELKAEHPWAAKTDPSIISDAIWLYDNQNDVTLWRQNVLDDEQRANWNSPKVLKRHYTAWVKRGKEDAPKKVVSRTSHKEQIADFMATIANHEAEIKRLRNTAKEAKASRDFWVDDQSADQIATALIKKLTTEPDKIRGVIAKVSEAIGSDIKSPRKSAPKPRSEKVTPGASPVAGEVSNG